VPICVPVPQKERAIAREVSAESNRDKTRRLEKQHALELFGAKKLRTPSKERLARTDPEHVQATTEGFDAIVEYMSDDGWHLARVSWETYQVILERENR
jgi:hypothetical protein